MPSPELARDVLLRNLRFPLWRSFVELSALCGSFLFFRSSVKHEFNALQ